MNRNERTMLDLIKRGRDEFGIVALKAEFEAEGTRPDELLRLLEIAFRADIKLALKIGGCEALSDLFATKLYGANYVIAPMVETPYALTKFVESKSKSHVAGDTDTEFLVNMETKTGLSNLADMASIAVAESIGFVFGRVDFTLSCGMPRGAINDPRITESVLEVARVCATHDLSLVVGGSVTTESLPALRQFRALRLDRFETRKVVFDGALVESPKFAAGIQVALDFEACWLINKRDYYAEIAAEDSKRIEMIQARAGKERIR
jgi:hypothetical protein